MYNDHFGLERSPFRITPDTSLFYTGGGRGEVLDALVYAITSGEGIIKVTGEVGTGKTMLCRMLEDRLPDNVDLVYLANPSLSPDDIVHAIALELGIQPAGGGTRIELVFQLQQILVERHAENRRVVVLIEEAQSMPTATLEEVRLLSNLETKREKLLQIVLFGQPELDEKLAAPEIRQLRERITHSFQLKPLANAEIRDYVNFRLRASGYRGRDAFAADACRVMSRASEGLVRRVNILADKALLAAYAEDTHDVAKRHVTVAIKDSEFRRARRRRVFSFAAMVAVAVAAAGVGWIGAQWLSATTLGPGAAVDASVANPDATAVAMAEAEPASETTGDGNDSGVDAQVDAPTNQVAASPAAASPIDAMAATPDVPVAPALPSEATESEATAAVSAAVEPDSEPPVMPESVAATSPESVAQADPVGVVSAARSVVVASTPLSTPLPRSEAAVVTPPPQDAVPSDEAPAATPDRLVRTLITALSEGDARMLAPPAPDVVVDERASVASSAVPQASVAAARPSQPAVAAQAPPTVAPEPAAPASVEPIQAATAVEQPPAPQPPASAAEPPPPAPVTGDLLEQRLAVTSNWLASRDPKQYTIQLLATVAKERRSLIAFLDRQRLRNGLDQIYVYETSIRGRAWYSVVFGTFDTYSEAQKALKRLPRDLARHSPFIRNLSDLSVRS